MSKCCKLFHERKRFSKIHTYIREKESQKNKIKGSRKEKKWWSAGVGCEAQVARECSGPLSFHRWKRAVVAALWSQPHAVPATLWTVRPSLRTGPRRSTTQLGTGGPAVAHPDQAHSATTASKHHLTAPARVTSTRYCARRSAGWSSLFKLVFAFLAWRGGTKKRCEVLCTRRTVFWAMDTALVGNVSLSNMGLLLLCRFGLRNKAMRRGFSITRPLSVFFPTNRTECNKAT